MLIQSIERRIAPFAALETIAPTTRQTYATNHRFDKPVTVDRIDFIFANNTQFTLKNGLWAIRKSSVANDEMPAGRNLLAEYGGTEHVTGDDERIPIELGAELLGGDFLAFTSFNSDTSSKTLNARAHLSQTITRARGYLARVNA